MTVVQSGQSAIYVADHLAITAFEHLENHVEIAISSLSVGGAILEPHLVERTGETEWRYGTEDGSLGSIRLTPVSDGLALECSPEVTDASARMELTVEFDPETRFHLPDGFNLVRMFDSDMPVGRTHTCRRGLNLCVVESPGMAIAIRSEDGSPAERLGQARRTVSRTARGFLFSISVAADQRIVLSTHPDIATAQKWFAGWMEGLGVLPRSRRSGSPEWVDNTRLVITVDMLRSTGEVAHDYGDLENLAGELAAAGCPRDTLFYIPGWNGPYDAAYPDYFPRPELGGPDAFERMMEAVHRNGYRVMIHTNADGLDPYHRDIDTLIKYAVRDKEGRYAGFQTPSATKMGAWGPPFRFLPFGSGRQRITLSGDGPERGFMTVAIPDTCEACITIGGLEGVQERICVSHEERTMRSPEGWFAANGEYQFPFALRLGPGENFVGLCGPREAPDDAWYRIHDCRVPLHPASIWTYPILAADVDNDEWNELVVGNIAEAVERYEIDAIHCDAADYEPTKKFFQTLRDRLPKPAIACEYFTSVSGYGYFDFSQSWRSHSLVAHGDSLETATDFHELLPEASSLSERVPWLDKASPLTGLTDGFTRFYPHLCHADAFVPVGKVCTCSEAVSHPFGNVRLRELLDDASRLGYIPGLRVNYRHYGLDDCTSEYVSALGKGTQR